MAAAGDAAPPSRESLAGPFYADGLDPALAVKFARWAELLAYPPPEEVREALELRHTSSLGLHMVARRPIKSGDLVLSERALLTINARPGSFLQEFDNLYGPKAGFLLPGVCVDWERESAEACKAALELFWAHPLMTHGPMVEDNMGVCEDLLNRYPVLKSRFDVRSLIRFLHVVDLNIHKDEESESHPSRAGIFVFGSKFTHGCEPNCSWSFDAGGRLQYRTCRNVEPGDILTFSYVGNGMNLLGTTWSRRRRLASLWFVCQCSRCRAPDLVRQVPCKRCGASRVMPMYEDCSTDGWTGERPLRELIQDARRWRCDACGTTCEASELPLEAEYELTKLVPEIMQWGYDMVTPENIDENRQQCAAAARILGKRHCTWAFFTFAWLQKWLVMVRFEPFLVLPERALRAASGELARFFAETCPRNTEQRLSALFLSARLANQLGGSLLDWGYDPEDPLGDNGASRQVLLENGWRVAGGTVQGPDEVARAVRSKGATTAGGARQRRLYRGDWR